ncbi:hypothetical protein RQCS_08400 [Rhodococcus qingshengii]|nr:hypothetical protein RQCS_08400 [Rhodococcus qingshengii]
MKNSESGRAIDEKPHSSAVLAIPANWSKGFMATPTVYFIFGLFLIGVCAAAYVVGRSEPTTHIEKYCEPPP